MKSDKEVIELLKQDKIAIENDCIEKLELLRKIFKNAFPDDKMEASGKYKYYFNGNGIIWGSSKKFTKPQEIIKLSEIYEVPNDIEVNNPIEVVKNGIFIPNSIINDFQNDNDLVKFIKQQLS